MKTLLATLALVAAIATGCSSTPDKEQRCSSYAEVYSLYLAGTAIRPVSKEESVAAAAAALFLQTYCGWTGTKAGTDSNGVPILVPPR